MNELSEIALKPNVIQPKDYFDKLIRSEESERKPGWKKRVQEYENLKRDQGFLQSILDKPKTWDPIADHAQMHGVSMKNKRQNRASRKKKQKSQFGWKLPFGNN